MDIVRCDIIISIETESVLRDFLISIMEIADIQPHQNLMVGKLLTQLSLMSVSGYYFFPKGKQFFLRNIIIIAYLLLIRFKSEQTLSL